MLRIYIMLFVCLHSSMLWAGADSECNSMLDQYIAKINSLELSDNKMFAFNFTTDMKVKSLNNNLAQQQTMSTTYDVRIGKGVYIMESPEICIYADANTTYAVMRKQGLIYVENSSESSSKQMTEGMRTQVLQMQKMMLESGKKYCSNVVVDKEPYVMLDYVLGEEESQSQNIRDVRIYFDENENVKKYTVNYKDHPNLISNTLTYNKFFDAQKKPSKFDAAAYMKNTSVVRQQFNRFKIIDNR